MLTDPIDAELIEASPNLRVVSTLAVGCDNIDLEACAKRNIPVGNTPGVLTDATADLTLALLLALARRLPDGLAEVRKGLWQTWEPNHLLGIELRDLTVGIIGAGRIGTAVAKRCEAFGMSVITSGRPAGSNPGTPLDKLLAASDVVSLHCPLTPQTNGLVDAEFLAKMRPGALLINTARGAMVDQLALAEALTKGDLAGAALDVTNPEPLPAHDPLLKAPNLIVLPHLGSATVRTRQAMAEIAVDNLLAGLAGEPLAHQVGTIK
jgi:glyoxylate reductase